MSRSNAMKYIKKIIAEIDLLSKEGRIKMAILVLGFTILVAGLPLTFYGVLKQTTSSELCALCHAMKPEYYTWQTSSHYRVKCVNCHRPEPGIVNYGKYIFKGAKEIFYTVTNTYPTPIKLLSPIPDRGCEECHNMNNRVVTAGDLIVPHAVHKKKKVQCYKCHSGIAHGHIASRRVTYRSDYSQWDSTLGRVLMSDQNYRVVDMDVCIRCHQLRKAPLECKVCHTSGMLPGNHRSDDFKNGRHGQLAAQDLRYCHSCHQYMTYNKIENLKEPEQFTSYLEQGKPRKGVMTADLYARANTYCKDCHGKRPPSHKVNLFLENHGQLDKKKCKTCHDHNPNGDSPVTKAACGSCHPSTHTKNFQWELYHPIEIPSVKPKVNEKCYACHPPDLCGRCHTSSIRKQSQFSARREQNVTDPAKSGNQWQ